jgi:hypothetical protein
LRAVFGGVCDGWAGTAGAVSCSSDSESGY